MEGSVSAGDLSTMESAPRLPARGGSTRVRRFNGLTRRTTDWDGLRKDKQLWFSGADCLVHLYTQGASQRGASLKLPFEAVQKLCCSYLTDNFLVEHDSSDLSDQSSNSSSESLSSDPARERAKYELFIPAPLHLARSQAFSYHLTTRNLLAYAVGSPVVGERLSAALTDLWNRLAEWNVPSPLSDFTTYMEKQGYLNFAQNSEHALACLKFAENARLKDIWVDAFAHCVGMHERLDLSPEFSGLKKATSALITRASLEMDLHIGRIVRALGTFLETELGSDQVGLSRPARDHLDYFRSFLHGFYVDKLGYFPPRHNTPWDKRPWAGMYQDFQCLYDYLVDADSSSDRTTLGLGGGICVVQNVQAFDEKHGYEPLPHLLSLLPKMPVKRRQSLSSQKTLLNLKMGKLGSAPETKITLHQALAIATNSLDSAVTSNALVQEYQRFERRKWDSKIDIAEARKVRWILIYGVLQMLASIMKGPKEVRNFDTLYPICVLTSGCPPWVGEENSTEAIESPTQARTETMLVPDAFDAFEGRSSRISIHPDCEADSAEDFFASNSISRQESFTSLNMMAPSPLRMQSQLSRTASIRSNLHSSVSALSKSVVGSISRRNSSRRTSIQQEPRRVELCDVVFEDHADETETEDEEIRPQTAVRDEIVAQPDFNNPLHGFDFDLAATNGEPTLEHDQLDTSFEGFVFGVDDEEDTAASPSGSYFSGTSPQHTASNRSSYATGDESPGTELSSWDGGSRRQSGSSVTSSSIDQSDDDGRSTKTQKQLGYQTSNLSLISKASSANVNAGCYVPTGMTRAFAHKLRSSRSSSIYAEEPIQADDIEEVEIRGRRSSRAHDRFAAFGTASVDDTVSKT